MKSGYDQFFKDARKNAAPGKPVSAGAKSGKKNVNSQGKPWSTSTSTFKPPFELSGEDLERQLKQRLGMSSKPKKRKKTIPWKLMALSFVGVLAAVWGIQNFEEVERTLKRIEISYLGSAYAEEAAPAKSPKAPEKKSAEAGENKTADGKKAEGVSGSINDGVIDHLSKLNDRKKELDEKEEELARIEQELQAQKEELEKRLKDLEGVRRGISSVLEEKVKVDEKKLDTLVLIYSDMKPPQAAKVFETMDEDLAVGILGRMKKKNAADIMTLLKSEKAQALTEKFAGYKRK